MTRLAFFLIIFCLTDLSHAQDINDQDSNVQFEIGNLGINKVRGTFTGFEGTVNFNPNDAASGSFDVCINAASIDTGNKKRDKHLRSEDFFEVEKFPKICFRSESIAQTTNGFTTSGILTMHGIEQKVEIPFTYADGVITGNLQVLRRDYGVGPKGGFMAGKKVDLKIVCVLGS